MDKREARLTWATGEIVADEEAIAAGEPDPCEVSCAIRARTSGKHAVLAVTSGQPIWLFTRDYSQSLW